MSELLYGNKKKRIIEYIDSNGASRFVPQYKFLWWWFSYETYPCGQLEFFDYEKCKEWLLYERTVSVSIHAV